MYYVLKTSDVLEILVPILYHISEARNDSTRVGLIHMGVFLILLLSGERNFGVRLNKAYITKAPIDVPTFTGIVLAGETTSVLLTNSVHSYRVKQFE